MKYYSIANFIGVEVDDSYPWVDTLFINAGISVESEELYSACGRKIRIEYKKEIDKSDVRFIGDGAYINRNVYVDEKYGVRFTRNDVNSVTITASSECNEWLVIALELMFLEGGKTLLHAAAVEKDGKVLLMPSWGGVGKTATVCRFVRDYGWRLLGDDLIIIGEGGAESFLKPFVIYPYHKELFPEAFEEKGNHTVKNMSVSNLMSKMIPTVKRVLRPFPKMLAYLRKHNPQSMRVPPQKLFTPEQLSVGGEPFMTVWLERVTEEGLNFRSAEPCEVVSRAVTVSSGELFAEKLNSVFHLCGCGIFSYDETFGRIKEILDKVFGSTNCYIMEIPTEVKITEVGQLIYDKVSEELGEKCEKCENTEECGE